MAEEIVVDPSALDSLAARIQAVHDSLVNAKETFGDPYGGLQSRAVEDGLGHFNSAWSQARSKLVKQLGDAQAAVRSAVEQFVTTDTTLAGSFDANGPAAPGQ